MSSDLPTQDNHETTSVLKAFHWNLSTVLGESSPSHPSPNLNPFSTPVCNLSFTISKPCSSQSPQNSQSSSSSSKGVLYVDAISDLHKHSSIFPPLNPEVKIDLSLDDLVHLHKQIEQIQQEIDCSSNADTI